MRKKKKKCKWKFRYLKTYKNNKFKLNQISLKKLKKAKQNKNNILTKL